MSLMITVKLRCIIKKLFYSTWRRLPLHGHLHVDTTSSFMLTPRHPSQLITINNNSNKNNNTKTVALQPPHC